MFIIKLLSQHVSGITMSITRRIRPCPTACGVLPGCVGCGWLWPHPTTAYTPRQNTACSRTRSYSPDDGHSYARNMLRQKFDNKHRISCILLVLCLQLMFTMHGHKNLKIVKEFRHLPNTGEVSINNSDFNTSKSRACGPGSSVGIATDYGLDGPGLNPGGDEILRPSRPSLGPIQPPVQWVPGSFPVVKCSRGVLLTTHPLLVPRSWKSRAISLPTLWATPGL